MKHTKPTQNNSANVAEMTQAGQAGPQRGRGRPMSDPDRGMKIRIRPFLYKDAIEHLTRLGSGNLSQGIDMAYQFHKAHWLDNGKPQPKPQSQPGKRQSKKQTGSRA